MAVSPKPQPTSRTLSPSLTGSDGKIASLWWVSPSTRTCLNLMNFGTRMSFQKSTYWALCTFASTVLMAFPPRYRSTGRRARQCSGASDYDGHSGRAPLGEAILQAPHFKSPSAQQRDRLESEDAIFAAAVGDDFLGGIEFGKTRFQCTKRDVHRPRQMSQGEFVRRAHVENRDRSCTQAL